MRLTHHKPPRRELTLEQINAMCRPETAAIYYDASVRHVVVRYQGRAAEGDLRV